MIKTKPRTVSANALLCGLVVVVIFTVAISATAQVTNGGFEDASLKGWKDWRLRRASISTNAFAGRHAVALGSERAMCAQNVNIIPDSRYRLSAYVRTEAGSEEVQLTASDSAA